MKVNRRMEVGTGLRMTMVAGLPAGCAMRAKLPADLHLPDCLRDG
jgi:hypothetical protein